MRDIQDVNLQPEGGVAVSFSIGRVKKAEWLIVRVNGDYGVGSRGNPNGAWISCMMAAGLARFSCHGVVLDFTGMTYTMSDSLYRVIGLIRKQRSMRFPVYVLVSDRCRDGVSSLLSYVRDEFTRIIDDLEQVVNNA